MRCIFALLLCIAIPSVVFAADAQSGYKVTYDGGSLADTKVGSGLKLVINSSTVTFLQDKSERVNIPASAITEISYGQAYIGEWEQQLPWAYSRSGQEHW